jgi:glycosyltransferase involved in cell wall biosynthesis
MNNKRLSIIIPFYNVEQYIAQCLDSVYHQDIPEEEYEVICVDDCSPDNSISIVEEYAKKHTNLVIVRNQYNRKLGGARNAGMEVAKGNYIWFVDSDDFIKTSCVGKLLSIAERDKLDVLHFQYENYPDTWTPPRNPADGTIMTGFEMFFSSDYVWYHDLVTAWRKIYRRQFLLENNIAFAEHIMFEDNDYAIAVFANAKRVKHITDCVYCYRYNPESITRVKYTSEHIGYWLNLCHRLRVMKDNFISEKHDARFVELIDGFIRNNLCNIMKMYDQVETIYKKEATRLIRKQIDQSMKPYISKQKYYKIKLSIL